MFSERTAAFIGAGVTVLAFTIFFHGLFRAWAVTHPDSSWAHGYLLLDG